MDDLPRRKLRELIENHGQSLASDPRRCEALLRDVCGAHKREIHVLVNALKGRVAEDLLGSSPQTLSELLFTRMAKRLQDEQGLEESVARWAVDSWALALGMSISPPASGEISEALGFASLARSLTLDTPIFDALAFSPDSRLLLTHDHHGVPPCTTRLWDVASGVEVWKSGGVTHAAAFTVDGGRILSSGFSWSPTESTVRTFLDLWSPTEGTVRTFLSHETPVSSLALSNDGRLAVSGGEDLAKIGP